MNHDPFNPSHQPNPMKDTLIIIGIYALFGVLWILLSDTIVDLLFEDIQTIRTIQLLKGWFYVILTAGIFFVIIYKRITLYKQSADIAFKFNEELQTSYNQLQVLESNLHQLAYYDLLTKLPNRLMMEEEIKNRINQYPNGSFAFIYFDLDNFKHINESLGHQVGDIFLQDMAKELTKIIKKPDFVCRIGGDEFVIVHFDSPIEQAKKDVEALLKIIPKKWLIQNQEFYVSISAGLAVYPEHGQTVSELFQAADTAMYESKRRGKDCYTVFEQHMKVKTEDYIELNKLLRQAITRNEFTLAYQPQYDLKTRKIKGYEALIRWNQPQKGWIAPNQFIGFAEQIGLILPIEEWVFQDAFKQAKQWNVSRYGRRISINLSAISLLSPTFLPFIKKLLDQCQVSPESFIIEVTESAIIDNLDYAIQTFQTLKDMGFQIALDDFGTGYSSLTYLQRLPIDILKIDRSFLPLNPHEIEKVEIFSTIIQLAHSLKLRVVAEGIEDEAQLQMVESFACDEAQGYYFAKPKTSKEIEKDYIL